MTREELIAYDKWLTRRKWGTGEIISPEKAADLYLAEHPLPPAEGAEEILRSHPYLKVWIENLYDSEMKVCSIEQAIWAMERFATLHAQQIADKMVSERLREELGKFIKWYNSGYEQARKPHLIVKEYLKSREK